MDATSWILMLALLPAQARVDWHSVDAGGGESAAGRYTVRGTIGQSDADEISLCSPDGGAGCVAPRYELTGGFWTGTAGDVPQADDIFRNGFEA